MKETPSSRPAAPFRHGPGAAFSGGKPKHAGQAASRLWHSFGRSRHILLATLLFSIGSVVASAIGPWQLGRATDMLVANLTGGAFDYGALLRQLLLVAGIYVLASALNLIQAWVINDLVQGMGLRLRAQAQAKLSRVPLNWYDTQPSGEVLSRFTNDIDNLIQNLQQVSSQAVLMLLTILGVLAMMLLLSPVLALVALLSTALSMVLTRLIAGAARTQFSAQWRQTGELNATVEESFTGQTLIRVFGARKRIDAHFATQNAALMESSMRAQILSNLIHPLTMFVSNLAYIGVIMVGAFHVLSGSLSLGILQAFIQYIRQMGQPVSQLGSMVAQVQSALASAERVFELLDAPEMGPDPTDIHLPARIAGHVRFEHVVFRYRPEQPLFEDVSFEAMPGQMLAIVGPTGAGKTTLVNLLMRFYETERGDILLDGRSIRELTRTELRRAIAMVLQDTWLFTGTIHDNIAYGRPESTREEVIAAARRCQVDDFVRTLPAGYDTVLENAGASLSQGQRQLLTIARAFLMDAPVLILDEATSSVDTRTEMQIQHAMAELRQGRTSFVIAHRLSTIRDADLILYMEAGGVRESGTHEALMALRGGYWALQQGGV